MSKEEDVNPIAYKSKKMYIKKLVLWETNISFMRNFGRATSIISAELGKQVQNLLLKIHVASFNSGF